MEVSGQLHAPTTLPPGKSPWYALDRKLGGPQSKSGHSGEEKYSQPLPGLEPPIIHPVAQRYTTELSWLLTRPGSQDQIIKLSHSLADVSRPWEPCAILSEKFTSLIYCIHTGTVSNAGNA
jgi:hypothetical protein